MQFPPAPPLKSFDQGRLPLAGARHSGAPRVPTKLTPFDLSGILAKFKPAAAPGTAEATTEERSALRAQAQTLVAQTFFGTLMKQMRNSPFKSELFEGGRGGQAFAPLYDQKLVEQMSRGAGNKLVNAIVRQFEASAAYRRQKNKEELKGAKRVNAADRAGGEPTARQGNAAAADDLTLDAARRSTPSARDVKSEQNKFKDVRIHVAPGLRS